MRRRLADKVQKAKVLVLAILWLCVSATAAQAGGWLTNLNYYRARGGLPPVVEDRAWSDGAWKHSRYAVKNGTLGHFEDPNLPWYTPEGDYAARNSNLTSGGISDRRMIQNLMATPFHGLGMIDPELRRVGFGSYREDSRAAGTLNILSGLETIPAATAFPIMWPANGRAVDLLQFSGGEYPDPLTSSPGYAAPAGLPIILQIGSGDRTPRVTATSFLEEGRPLEHFVFDETSYNNPDAQAQELARSILDSRDAVVLIPRRPLREALKYDVSITTNGTTYNWSFRAKDMTRPLAAQLASPALSTRASKTTAFRVSWAAADPSPSSGIVSYLVQYKAGPQDTWAKWARHTASSGVFKGSEGRTYLFRARAKDRDGNVGPWSAAKRTVVPYDNDSLIEKRTGFDHIVKKASSPFYRRTTRYSTTKGDTISYRFTGKSVALITAKDKNRSKAKIYIDGKYKKTVNTYSASAKYRRVVYRRAFSKIGTHTIKIVNVGNKERLDVDGLGVGR